MKQHAKARQTSLNITLSAAILALSLTGCGGSDEPGNHNTGSNTHSVSGTNTVSGTISGVAATGNAISGGVVTLKCAGGLSLATTVTDTEGDFSFTASNITLPCLAKVDYTDSNNNPASQYSHVSALGTSNITPLTTMLVAALYQAQPADIFAAGSFKTFSDAEYADGLAAVESSLEKKGVILPDDFDPVHDTLTAKTETQTGNEHDQILDAVGFQLTLNLALGTADLELLVMFNNGELGIYAPGTNPNTTELGIPIVSISSTNSFLGSGSYIINPLYPPSTMASDLSTHELAGSYVGNFKESGESCTFTVNPDASVTSGFALPLAEGDNAHTAVEIPAAAFQAASAYTPATWIYHDSETQRRGALGVTTGDDGLQSVALVMLDEDGLDEETCKATLSNP